MPRPYKLASLLIVAGCLSLAALVQVELLAQVQIPRAVRNLGEEVAEEGSDAFEDFGSVHLPSDRTLTRGIQRAKKRIAAGEYSQAIRFLNEVLARPEDAFVRVDGGREFAGLKETAQAILRQLPAEGRQAYESTFGPEAKRMLREAVASGNAEKMAAVANQFFYTPAGLEAALLLAAHEADLGRHLAAALIYEHLLETPSAVKIFDPQLSISAAVSWLGAGKAERAEQLIDTLRQQGHRSVQIAGEKYQLDSQGGDSLAWLSRFVGNPALVDEVPQRQWLTHRGNPARNAQTVGGLPHMRVHWQSRLLFHHSRLERACDELGLGRQRSGRALPVAAIPLAVGDTILTRSAQNLVAVDFRTGKLVWQEEPQRVPAMEQLIHAAAQSDAGDAQVQTAKLQFAQRVWEDYLYNIVSSDGQRVFVLRDLKVPEPGRQGWPFMMGRRGGNEKNSGATNRLCAYDLATQGKLVWEVDGANLQGELPAVFFLGAPMALGQSLYCLCEAGGVINLVVLDRESGHLRWQQPLANLEENILYDVGRRLQATTPSYEAGMLVCPTGAGVVIGVDLAKRSLAWAYRYDAKALSEPAAGSEESRWMDSSITIARGRVLVTPPESKYLHCLDLASGKLLWKQRREDHRFLACVEGDRILLLGNRQYTALRLSDGGFAWPQESAELPPRSVPSGRGFLSEGKYYLPLSTAEVAAIEVETGQIVASTVSRDGQVLGNLICHRGAVISQTGRFLERYDQVEVLRRRAEAKLAHQPEDVVSLRTLGEIAYNEGRVAEAIDLLERAYSVDSNDGQTRNVLSECLVAALDEDFGAFRQRLPLLKRLYQTPGAEQVGLLRVQAKGLLEIGQPIESMDACIRMALAIREPNQMLAIGKQRTVRVTRWLRAQTRAIWDAAESDLQLQISKKLQDIELRESGQEANSNHTNSNHLVQRYLDCFGDLPLADPIWMEHARRLGGERQALAAQQIFLRLLDSTEESLRNEATARLAQGLHERGLHRQALQLDRQLAGPLAEAICLDGMTGSECLEQWKVPDSDTTAGKLPAAWPPGKVQVSLVSSDRARIAERLRMQLMGVRLERCDAVLGSGNVLFSKSTGAVVASDSFGNEFFIGRINDDGNISRAEFGSPYGVARGSLLVLSLGKELVAFDTLVGEESQPSKKIWQALWRHQVTSGSEGRFDRYPQYRAKPRPGSFRAPRSRFEGEWTGVIGPVTQDSCIFVNQHRLMCLDPLSGEVQWTRNDVPPGCDLYGDGQILFVVGKEGEKAEVFHTQDGRRLGTATVPKWREQVVTQGRSVIRWRTRSDGRRELSAVDALSGKVAWKFDFESLAWIDIAKGRFVAVLESSGHGVIIDAQDGKVLVDRAFEENPMVDEIHLLAGSDHFVLATSGPPKAGTVGRLTGIRGFNGPDYPVIRGAVYVLERQTGQPVWDRPAKLRQQALMLTQPLDLPVLAFAGILPKQDANGSRADISMLILEKSSGQSLYKNDSLRGTGAGHCVVRQAGDDQSVVEVEMPARTVRLKFTGASGNAKSSQVYTDQSETNENPGGLLRIFQKLGSGVEQ